MKRRYDSIQQGYTDADALRASAQGEVAAYQTALAEVKAEAAAVVESARQVLEGERQARLTAVNASIAERKAAAAADAAAARQAAETHVNEAAGSVASRLVELVTGNQPSDESVRAAVDAASGAVVR
jgi:F0F1-type ATP synthase membrane subunit b/b'